MDEVVKKGNFEFVEKLFPGTEIYLKIQGAEKYARLDYIKSGMLLRDVLDELSNSIITQNKILVKAAKGSYPTVSDKISALKREKKLPFLKHSWSYYAENGKWISGDDPYYIWRVFGNQCAHPDSKPTDPVVNYENLLSVLEIVYSCLSNIYIQKFPSLRYKLNKKGFVEKDMPIGDNYIISYSQPIDKDVSHCIAEYETCSYTDTGRVDKYGIIRQFKKNSIDEKLLQLRDVEAFGQASNEAGIQFAGNVQVDVLSRMNSTNSDFYIVAYKFSREPKRLDTKLLSSLSMEDRERICRQVATIVYKLHTLSTPIYHRNISYDCIYVCENGKGELEASIIKLDCAKIDSNEFGTVIQNLQNKQNMINIQTVMKYFAPEVRGYLQGTTSEISWEKADIYSLGVLFADILSGSIDTRPVPTLKLQTEGVNVDFSNAIDRMRNPRADARPSLDSIIAIVGER